MGSKRITSNCPIEVLFDLIGGRWKPVVLKALWDHGKPLRFKLLRERIPLVSPKILTQQLKELERDGFIKRKMFSEMPVRVEYSLTVVGKELGPILLELDSWARKHILGRTALSGVEHIGPAGRNETK
jgi:DNA-binding HxlR family transcriptional regulator